VENTKPRLRANCHLGCLRLTDTDSANLHRPGQTGYRIGRTRTWLTKAGVHNRPGMQAVGRLSEFCSITTGRRGVRASALITGVRSTS
jgi:hypothetical protein